MSTAIPRRTPVSTAQRTGLGLAIALGMALSAGGALAQYKVVGPDGSVTYTDRPPTGATQVRFSTTATDVLLTRQDVGVIVQAPFERSNASHDWFVLELV